MIVQLTILYLLVPLIYPSPLHSPRQPFAKESNEQPKKETRIPSDVDQFNNFGLTMNHKEHEDPVHLNTKTIKEVSFVAEKTHVEPEVEHGMKNDVINTSEKTPPTQKLLKETSLPEKYSDNEENNLVDDDDLHVESTTTVSAQVKEEPELNQQIIGDLVAPTILIPVSKSTTGQPSTDTDNENYLNVLEPAQNDDLENIVATMEPTLRELEGKHEAASDDVVTSPLTPVVLTPTDELTSSTLVPLIDSIRQNVYFDEDPQSVPDEAFNEVQEDLSDSDVDDKKEDELQRLEDVKTTIKLPQVVNNSRQYPMAHQSKGDSYTDLIPKLPIVPTETPRTEMSSVAECFVSILARFVSSIEVDLQKEEEETFWQSVVAGIQCAMRDCRAALPSRPEDVEELMRQPNIMRRARHTGCLCMGNPE